MIGNVFYNMLTYIYRERNDKRIGEMADQMKSMLQERRFDNLMGPKVPFMKDGILNLL